MRLTERQERREEFLSILKEVLRDAIIRHTDIDDCSGCNSTYFVDHEQLLKNIDAELEKIEGVKNEVNWQE